MFEGSVEHATLLAEDTGIRTFFEESIVNQKAKCNSLLREFNDALPDYWIAVLADNALWVFAAGIVASAWCYSLLRIMRRHHVFGYLAEAWQHNNWCVD
jgi:hypothetical protein